MRNPYSYTEYQLGTAIYWLMKTPSSGDRRLNLKALSIFPIEEDPSESWLERFPEDRQVSREVAAAALRDLRDNPERFQIDQLVDAGDEYLATKAKLEDEMRSAEAKYRRALELLLFRSSESSDIDTALQLHAARKAERQDLNASAAKQHLTSLRTDILAKRELHDHVRKVLGSKVVPETNDAANSRERELQQHQQMAEYIAKKEGHDR